MEDQIERGLKWVQDSRSSSKWSKSFPWKWSWLRRRSAFLSISGQFNFMEYHGIPSEYHLPCIQIFPCVRFNEFNDESSKAAWHRREAALGEWICPRVFVAEVLRSWMQMHICYGWMLNSQEKHTIYWLLCNIYIYTYMSKQDFLLSPCWSYLYHLPSIHAMSVGSFPGCWGGWTLARTVVSKRGLGERPFVVACLWVNGPCRWMEIWQKNM
jgi:hypothetical protein